MDQNDKSRTRLCQRLLDDNIHKYAQRPKQGKIWPKTKSG